MSVTAGSGGSNHDVVIARWKVSVSPSRKSESSQFPIFSNGDLTVGLKTIRLLFNKVYGKWLCYESVD